MTSGLMRCFRWKTGWFNNETSVEILDFDVVLLPVDLQTTCSSVRCFYVKLSDCITLTMADVYLWLSVKCQRSTRLSDFSVAAMHWALHLHLQHVTRVHVGKKESPFLLFIHLKITIYTLTERLVAMRVQWRNSPYSEHFPNLYQLLSH